MGALLSDPCAPASCSGSSGFFGSRSVRRFLRAVGFALLLVPATQVLAEGRWFFPVYLTLGDLWGDRSVATDWRGWVHVVCEFNGQVHYVRSEGEGWQPMEILSESSVAQAPAIATDGSGNVHVVWFDYRNGNYEIYYKHWDGLAWSADVRLTDAPLVSQYPSVAADPDGHIHVVWEDYRGGGNAEIYYKCWDGIAWSEDLRLTNNGSDSLRPSVAADLNGHVHVVWCDARTGYYETFYKLWDGTIWSADQQLSDNMYGSREPTLATDLNGDIHVVWRDQRDGNDEIYYKHWDGFAWSADLRLTDDSGDSEEPSIATDLSGHLHVTWYDNRDANWEVYYKQFDGMVWSDDQRLTHDSESSSRPSIASDLGGELHLVWAANGTIAYMRNADLPPPELTSVTPTFGHRDDVVGARLTGQGFVPPDSVWLAKEGEPRIVGQVLAVDTEEITCRLELTGATLGAWDVVVQNADRQQALLAGAFEVLAAIPWSDDLRLTVAPNSSQVPSIATDLNSHLHVVWNDERNGNREIYYKRWDGLAWSADLRLTNDPGESWWPSVAADTHGHIHVVWYDERDGNDEVYYKRWDGVAWSDDLRLTNDPHGSYAPSIATDLNNHVHVVWCDERDGNSELYYKCWDGVAWSADLRLTNASYDSLWPSVATDATGHVHVVWQDNRSANYDLYYKRWNGIVWSEDLCLANCNYEPVVPSIAADLNGYVHVVWQDYRNANYEICYKRWDGVAWSEDLCLTNASYYSSEWPSIATDLNGHAHVVWQDYRDGNREIYYKRWDGIVWSDDVRLTNEPSGSREPAIAADLSGNVHVVWYDNRDGNDEIYYKFRSGTAGPPPVVNAIDPSNAPDFGTHDITAYGENFVAPAEVHLSRGGETTLIGTTVESSESHVVARFDLTRVTQGPWTVLLISGDGQRATLPDGLTITESSWGPEERLTNEPAASSLALNAGRAMCWDAPGTLHLFWFDARDGNQEIYWKTKSADIWGIDQRLTVSTGSSAYPVCAAAPAGPVLIAWQDTRPGNAEIYSKLYVGGQWGEDVRVTNQPAPSQYPALAVDPTGTFHLVWEDGRSGNWEIYYNRYVGGLWDIDQRLTSDGASSRYPSMACDDAGNVYVAWADDRDGNWEIYLKVWDGIAWSADQRLTEDPGSSLDPSLGTDNAAGIYVVWEDDRDGNAEIYERRIDIPDADHRLTQDPAPSANAVVAATEDGDLHVFWSDTRTGIEQIWYKTCLAGDWSLDHRASGSAASATLPSVATGPDNAIDVVWRDQRDGNYEVYALARRGGMSGAPGAEPVTWAPLRVACVPNPFREGTTLDFGAPLQAGTQLAIYDLTGRRVRLLLARTSAAGVERQSWDGRDDHGSVLGAGVYFYRLESGRETHAGRIIRVR